MVSEEGDHGDDGLATALAKDPDDIKKPAMTDKTARLNAKGIDNRAEEANIGGLGPSAAVTPSTGLPSP